MRHRPKIEDHDDFRTYLKAMFEFLKEEKQKFSLRGLSREIGFRSPGFLKMIVDGKRNLSLKSIPRVARALGLSPKETNYFENLVLFNQAKDFDEANYHYFKLRNISLYRESKELESDQYDYLSQWYHMAIREMVTLKGFREDPKWIASRLNTDLTPGQVTAAIELLLRLKLLERDKDGHLKQTNPTLMSSAKVKFLGVVEFHRRMLEQSKIALEKMNAKERHIGALTMGVKRADLDEIQEEIVDFRRRLLKKYGSYEDNLEEIYQMNIQLFPLTKIGQKGDI